ncbi:MAG: hypothetical protein AAFY14_14980, partial [Pseudomonadota bacterium]
MGHEPVAGFEALFDGICNGYGAGFQRDDPGIYISVGIRNASDIALTLAEGGMRTAQFVGIPDTDTDVDAGVVALKSRTIPVA